MPKYTARHYEIARDYAIITRDGIISQDLKSPDGRLVVKANRIGSGFAMGYNVYNVMLDGVKILSGVNGERACTAIYLYAIGAFA